MTDQFLDLLGYALCLLASAPVVALVRGPVERVATLWLTRATTATD
jgi:hypothetical protein